MIVAASATRVSIPSTPRTLLASPERLRAVLPPSLAKRVRFVDRSNRLWQQLRAYFSPILDAARREAPFELWPIDILAWTTYLLFLAFKSRCEVAIDPLLMAAQCEHFGKLLSGEGRARLAVIEGLYRTYDRTLELPAFRITLSGDESFAERVEDILDDAHFLEVSALRRFVGIAQNRRAVVRDMRRLVASIVKTKKWASGAMQAATQFAHVPSAAASAVLQLAEELSVANLPAPILTNCYDRHTQERVFVSCERSSVDGEWRAKIVQPGAVRERGGG